jgi:thiol-disulfide isomerase/thioredoxin
MGAVRLIFQMQRKFPWPAGLLLLALAASLGAQTLRIGDAAPAIAAPAWLKGAPVTAYAPGRVYVVEFWATWCVPCKENIPHLTALAKKYPDRLTVVGVDVREREMAVGSVEKVRAFVAGMGDRMDYTVAMDDPTKSVIFKTWMEAAGMVGIPTAFVVDQAGRISWVGHPRVGNTELADAVAAALGGPTDYAAMAKKQAATFAAESGAREYKAAQAFITESLGREAYAALLASGQRLAAEPDQARRETGEQQVLLANVFLAPAQAEQSLRQAFAEKGKARIDLTNVLAEYGALLPPSFLKLAVDLLAQLPESDALLRHDLLGRVYFALGDARRAVEEHDQFVGLIRQRPNLNPGYLEALASQREQYLAARPASP